MATVVSDRAKNVLNAFAMAPFFGVSILFFVIALSHLEALRRIAAHVPSTSAVGPARLSGKITRPSGPTRAPSGAMAAGWAAWIATDDTDGRGRLRFNMLCRRAELSGLELSEGPARVPVDLARPGDPVDISFGSRLNLLFRSSGVTVHLGSLADGLGGATSTLPAEMRAACASELAGAQGSRLIYNEHLLDEGQEVEILACLRDGRAVACGDGVDALTTQKINAGQRRFSTVLFIGQAWTLAFVATLGFSAAARILRLRRARP
jgi:hypothetical protein